MKFARTWWLCCCLAACAPLQAATRVALVGGVGHEAAEKCLDLAEADLFGKGDIALVERREIAKLLAEGEMSLNGTVDAATAIRVGKLLSADLLALVETDPQSSQALGILVFETTSGLHLCDRALAESNSAEAGRQVAAAVRLAARKRAAPPGAQRTLCLFSVRNADLPLAANSLCDGSARLIERFLANSPDIAVLERKRFNWIKQEAQVRRLGQDTAETKLLAAVLTAEIEFRRGSGAELLATATLGTAGGQPLATVRAKVEYKDALALAEGLAPQLAAALKAAPAAGMTNRRAEAGRFACEALFWRRHDQIQTAMINMEAALAIDAESLPVLEAATEVCFSTAGDMLDPGRWLLPPRNIVVRREKMDDSLSLAERGLAIAEAAVQRHAAEHRSVLAHCLESVANGDGTFRIREPLEGMSFLELYQERLPLLAVGRDDDQRRIQALQQRYGRLLKALDARARAEVCDRPSFVRYTNWLGILLRNVELYSLSAREWGDDTAAFLEAWLGLADRYGVHQDEFFALNTAITATVNRSAQLDREQAMGRWVLTCSDTARLMAVFEKMAAHRHRAVAALGRAALFMGDAHWRQPLADDAAENFKTLLDRLKEVIREPGPDQPQETQVICYYALLDAVESLPTPRMRAAAFRDLADYMLGRGEMVYGAALAASEPAHVAYGYYAPYLYRTLGQRWRRTTAPAEFDGLVAIARRVRQQLDRRALACLDGQEGRIRYCLERACETMYLARPDLRPKTPPPWRGAVRLLSVGDYPELRAISRVLVRGNSIWTMGLGDGRLPDPANPHDQPARGTSDQSILRSQDDGRVLAERANRYGIVEPITMELTAGRRRTLPPRGYRRDSVDAAVLPYVDNCPFDLDDRLLCLGSFTQGLCLVPLEGGVAEWLPYEGQEEATRRGPMGPDVVYRRGDAPDDERLPSPRVLSVAIQDGKAYAALGGLSGRGTFLVSVRLNDRKVRVIVSSRGAQRQTPLDGLADPPLVFLPFVKDPARNRLLFVVSYPLLHAGLWELDTRSEKIRRLGALEHYIHWIGANRSGRVLLALASDDLSQWHAAEYDLARDRLELLYSSQPAPAVAGLKPGASAIFAPGWPAQPPYLRLGQTLWTGSPFGRIGRGSGGGVVFPPLEDKPELLRRLAGLRYDFQWRTMEPLEDGRILLADRHGIWLVTP